MIRPTMFAALLSGVSFFVAVAALPVSAQETPRVEGQDVAQGAEVVLNEVNSDAYPAVTVFATVVRDGAPVTGLAASDFRVREDEVDQEPLVVEEQLPPLSVVVTLDTSGSMSEALDDAQAAATAFVEGLSGQDSAQLVRFAREVETATSMTSTKTEVTGAITGLSARGDTALFDALMLSVDLAGERTGRKAIVVLSDGIDDDGTGQPLSEATLDDVLTQAAAVNVPIFVVGLGEELDEASLTQIADSTGGLYLSAPTPEELATVYDQIGAQLSGQYAISYTSSLPADGTTRRVDLEAADAQASKEYTASGSAPIAAAAEPEAPVVSPAAPSDGTCAPVAAMAEIRPDLEQAKSRYDQDLIDVTDRNTARLEASEVLTPSLAEPVVYECAVQAMEQVKALYDDDLIDVTERNRVRNALAAPLSQTCAGETTLEAVVGCFELFNDAYGRDLIDVTTRNTLRASAAQPLVDELTGIEDADEALGRVVELYDADLIDVTMRNQLQDEILARE